MPKKKRKTSHKGEYNATLQDKNTPATAAAPPVQPVIIPTQPPLPEVPATPADSSEIPVLPSISPFCVASTDDVSVTAASGYAGAVRRVNSVVEHLRESLQKYPPSFPNNTQHKTMVRLNMGLDVNLSYRTGGGKTLIMKHAPYLVGGTGVTCVVAPLNTLIKQLQHEFVGFGFKSERVHVVTLDSSSTIISQIGEMGTSGPPIILIGHPEDFINTFIPAIGRLKTRISLMIVDEAELITDWGDDFRIAYSQLSMLRDLNPTMRVFTASGSTNPLERELINRNLDLPSATNVVGPMNRRDLQINVLDTAGGLPSRNVADEILGSNQGTADKFIHHIFNEMNTYPDKVFAVYCETIGQCKSTSLKLNNFFESQGESAQSLPFYRHHASWMRATLQHFTDRDHKCRVLCCTVALGMGIHVSNLQNIYMKRLMMNLSMAVQMWSRAHRVWSTDTTTYGKVVIMNDFADFRRQKKRALILQATWQEEEQQETGQRVEQSLHALYELVMDRASCLQEKIECALGGEEAPEACTKSSQAKGCSNCRTKWDVVAGLGEAIEAHTTATNITAQNKALVVIKKFYNRTTNDDWSREIEIVSGTTIKVLNTNVLISKKLEVIVKKVLDSKRFGIPLAKLVDTVAARSQFSKKKGVHKAVVRWCLTYLIVKQMVEEVDDTSPIPPDTERASNYKPKRHVVLTNLGVGATEWPVIPINECLHQFW